MNTISMDANFAYQEAYLPNPKSRKYRYRRAKATTTVEIPLFTPDEAPVAFRYEEGIGGINRYTKEYRLFEGKLYVRVRHSGSEMDGGNWWDIESLRQHFLFYHSSSVHHPTTYKILDDRDECEAAVKAQTQGYAVMQIGEEMQVWRKTGEPRYVIATFGLGYNHGGTGVFVRNSYNDNVSKDRYFTALQYDEAIQTACEIATRRGDDKSIDGIKAWTPKIEVLLPEAVKCDPKTQHGDGDPFINKLERIIDASGNANAAGWGIIAGMVNNTI